MEEGWRLGGAHERAAHHDSFAARRDVRELLFDVALVDGVITLEDALALRGAALYYAALRCDERPLPAGVFFFESVVRVATASEVFSNGAAFGQR